MFERRSQQGGVMAAAHNRTHSTSNTHRARRSRTLAVAAATGAVALSLTGLTGCGVNLNISINEPQETTDVTEDVTTSLGVATEGEAQTLAAGLVVTYPVTWTTKVPAVVSDDLFEATPADGGILRVVELEEVPAASVQDSALQTINAIAQAEGMVISNLETGAIGEALTWRTAFTYTEQGETIQGTLMVVASGDTMSLVAIGVPQATYDANKETIDSVFASVVPQDDEAPYVDATNAGTFYADGVHIVGYGLNAGTYTLAPEDGDSGSYAIYASCVSVTPYIQDAGHATRTCDLTAGQLVVFDDYAATAN
jgi:hypothetical protein